MNKTLALLFLAGIIFCVPKAEAQSARISGNAKTYSGDTLRFYKYADFLTKEKVTVAKAFVDSAGYFSCRPSLDAVTELRIDLDVFEGILYVEPNSDLQITLPKKTQKLQEDALNPFFRAQEFYIKVLNADENTINPNLMKFEQMYGKLIPNLFEGTAGKVNSLKADGLFSAIEDSFAHIPNTFLNNYIKYDLVQLRFVAYKRDKDKIFNTYFSDSTVLFDNNAYNRALYDIFKSYLSNNKKIGINGGLYGDKNFGIMVSTVQKELNFENSELAEYLLLINIYEKFYVDNGLKKTIIDYLKKHRSEIKKTRRLD